MRSKFILTFYFSFLTLASIAVFAEEKSNGVFEDKIVLGMSNALSGPAKALGTNLKLGAQIYFDEVNASGGVHGRTIEVVSYDDGYEPSRTIANTLKLMKDDVFALFGYVGTPTSKVAVPIAKRAEMPYLFPFTGAEFLRSSSNGHVFNLRASYYNETEALVDYLVEKNGIKKIAMLIQDDGYGAAGRSGVQIALEKYGMESVVVGKYKRNTTDIDQAFNLIWEQNPEAVIMIGAYKPCAEFMKRSKAYGKDAIFMNISFVGTNSLIQEAGEAGEGTYISQVVPHPATSQLALIQQYRKSLEQSGHGDMINFGTLEGYLNAYVFVKALQKNGPEVTRASFSKTLASLRLEDGGLEIYFTPELHQGMHQVYLTKVEGGQAVDIYSEAE